MKTWMPWPGTAACSFQHRSSDPSHLRSHLGRIQLKAKAERAGGSDHRLRRDGSLLRERYWERCTLFDVNYRPKHMSVEELEQGVRWLFTELYNEGEYTKRKRRYMEIVKRRL